MTPAASQQAFDQRGPQGFGPPCVSGYVVNGEERFAAIWEQGRPAFDARFGLTAGEYQQTFDQVVGQGFRLRFVNAFERV
jgi:polyglycine hydrolase-like protein